MKNDNVPHEAFVVSTFCPVATDPVKEVMPYQHETHDDVSDRPLYT